MQTASEDNLTSGFFSKKKAWECGEQEEVEEDAKKEVRKVDEDAEGRDCKEPDMPTDDGARGGRPPQRGPAATST